MRVLGQLFLEFKLLARRAQGGIENNGGQSSIVFGRFREGLSEANLAWVQGGRRHLVLDPKRLTPGTTPTQS